MLTPELITFVEAGLSVLVGTRDARLFPECVRAVAARVERSRRELSVFVPVATGAVTVANLRDNGRIAVCFTRPRDHRSLQIKGSMIALREATPRDRPFVDTYRAALGDELAWVGLPLRLSRRMVHWPCHAVRLRIESLFDQTPGPGAGDPVSSAAGGTP